MGMSRNPLHVGARHWYLGLPHPNVSIGAATVEQSPIWAPGQRVHRAALTRKLLHIRAALGVPELDEGITPPVARRCPSGAKATQLTIPLCPPVQSRMPLATSHSLTILSQPPLASVRPSGLKASADTPVMCAGKTWWRVLPASAHTHTSPRQVAAAQYCPFLLIATAVMESKGWVKTLSCKVAPESRASCISTPCSDTPRNH